MTESPTIAPTIPKGAEKTRAKKPPMYRVVMLNDDVTPFNFVVDILNQIFKKDRPSAFELMMTIHNSGRGIAGVYAFEVAEAKTAQVHQIARHYGFPLTCRLEPEGGDDAGRHDGA